VLHPVYVSVRPFVPCLRFSRNRKAVENSNLVQSRVIMGTNLTSKGRTNVKVIGNENVKKIVFRAYLRQQWIGLFQPRPKRCILHIHCIVKYISPAEMPRFVIFVCNIIQEDRMSQRPPAVYLF